MRWFGKKDQIKAAPETEHEHEVQEPCACGNSCPIGDVKNARFIVLGARCKKSADSFANVVQAVSELGLSDEVLNIGNDIEIAMYGVMQTPALVVDSKVISQGKLITVSDAKKAISKVL